MLNKEIRPIPWLAKDAIKFLENFLEENKNAKILEFGCGGSTIWFSQRTNNLTSIEHNPEWYFKVKKYLDEHKEYNRVDLRLIQQDYYKVTNEFPDEYFDLILIDGIQRIKCIQASIRILKKDGILMLDNAERHSYKKVPQILKDWEFFTTVQIEPDQYDKSYKNWQTNWWIKK